MTAIHENNTTNDSQESHPGSGQAQASQALPPIRANTVHFGHPNDPNASHSTPNQSPVFEQAPNTTVYEGYRFYKADPLPGQKATWTRVERTIMHLDQSEFCKMVQKRANKISAAQQYQNLSDTRCAHVNQLIHEQRRSDPQVEWSCVYAKERNRSSQGRNAHRDDYEAVSMDIILMKRPMKTKSYPRTPMGDLVDLGIPFRLDGNDVPTSSDSRPDTMPQERLPELATFGLHSIPPNLGAQRDRSRASGQTTGPSRPIQVPLPRPVSVTSPFVRLDLGQTPPLETFDENAWKGHGNAFNGQTNTDQDGGWSSEASRGEDDESTTFGPQSDMSSTVDADDMDCERHESLNPQKSTHQHRSRSPTHRKRPRDRHMESKGRYHSWRHYYLDVMGTRNISPAKRARGSEAGNADPKPWEKRYRIQRIDDEELRSRLLGCEARIEQWEKAFKHQTRILQQIMEEARQLQRSRSSWNFPQVSHYRCNCSKNGNTE